MEATSKYWSDAIPPPLRSPFVVHKAAIDTECLDSTLREPEQHAPTGPYRAVKPSREPPAVKIQSKPKHVQYRNDPFAGQEVPGQSLIKKGLFMIG
jgi:hypothetical protein